MARLKWKPKQPRAETPQQAVRLDRRLHLKSFRLHCRFMSLGRWPFSCMAVLVLCAGCKRAPATATRKAASPVIISQVGDIVIKTEPDGEIDLDEQAERQKHRPPLTKSEGGTHDRASADKNFAQIDWHVRHACGTRVIPHVEIAGSLIHLSSVLSGQPATTPCTGKLSFYRTTIDGLPADTYRIVDEHGPHERGFDVMLNVPAVHQHY